MPHQGHQGAHHGNGHGHDSHDDGHHGLHGLHSHQGHGHHGHDDVEDCEEEANETSALLCADVDFSKVPVYPLVHEIRIDIVAHIDTPLTYDQLVAPDSTYTIIRPLTDKYIALQNPSVVFCLLLNRVQFISDSAKLSIATLSESRATLCEIIAIRVLRGWSERSLHLATVLLTPWPLFQGAPSSVISALKDDGEEEVLEHSATALEMAIISVSKRFIRSPSCQKVIEGIWSGKIIYTSVNPHAFIRDSYKERPIQIYNPHKAPILDHYRLKVPRIRAILEYVNFVILFVLYIMTIEHIDTNHMNGYELAFIVYALAFSLDKAAAMREHGLKVFASSLVNGFDIFFVIIFCVYLAARLIGFWTHNEGALEFGSDLIAVGAVFMFPRLVFMTLANNLMILSIRSMLTEFFFLMGVGIVCFLGFVYAMGRLAAGIYKVSQICWWMLYIYFGLDATGFQKASSIHPVLGPLLMVSYAFLSNTLLLTVAVAILGNTFAIISQDAAAESMFRKAVATIEGVKGDAVFSYQLPFNILAIVVLYPLSFILNARWFHKINVLMIRVTNLPVLLLIGLYDRQRYQDSSLWENVCDYADHTWGKITAAAGFDHIAGNRMDIETVFEAEREYGSYYDGWEDEEVFEEDETPTGDDATVLAEAGAMQDSPMAASPEQARFHRQGSAPPNSPRERSIDRGHKVSTGIQAANAAAMASAAAPLARVRRGSLSVYGPSPLAQLFVGSDQASHAAVRQRTINVGSLPATSSFPQATSTSVSPHRHRLSFAGLARSTTRPSLSPMEDTIEERPTPVEPSMSRSLSPSNPLRARTDSGGLNAPPAQRFPSYGSFQETRKKPQVTFQSPSPIIPPKDSEGGDEPAETAEPHDGAVLAHRAEVAAERAGVAAKDFAEESGHKQEQQEGKLESTEPKKEAEDKKEKQPPRETWPETLRAESVKSPKERKEPLPKVEGSARPIPHSARGTPGTAPGTSKGTPAESARSTPESSQLIAVGGDVPAPPKLSLPKAKQMRKPSPQTGGKLSSPHIAPTGVPGGKAPTTASELLEKLENKQGDKQSSSDRTMEQLRAIEARQSRIEDMLMRLLDGAGASSGGIGVGGGNGTGGFDRGGSGSGTARDRSSSGTGRGRPGVTRSGRSRASSRVEEEDEEESRPLHIRTPRHEEPHDTFDDYK